VDLKVPKGSFYCMLGGNGAGKSTLLKTVSGYIKPLRGKVKYMEDTKISMVPQNPEALFTEITVEEEMYEGISHMAFDDDYKIKKVEEMLETMEIG
ncbi:ATP-binding cassette domain-containing protein, partial [Acinetobacter baumannii]|nr:ATP-binding cassette domain-containing protein [Acinetobacter baumannii]